MPGLGLAFPCCAVRLLPEGLYQRPIPKNHVGRQDSQQIRSLWQGTRHTYRKMSLEDGRTPGPLLLLAITRPRLIVNLAV
jgi:hypothetical protein